VLRKIIAGVDPLPSSCDAAVLASALARAAKADLLVMTAYQDPLLPFPPSIAGTGRVHDAQRLLASLRPTWCPEGHTRAVPDYSAARALRRTARDEHADLVVLGSGRACEPGNALAGRTGRQVLHNAPCAVAFAAAGLHEAGAPVALRKVVVGLDDTPESEAAVQLARDLAHGAGAEVDVVGVVDDRLPVEAAPFGAVLELSRWDEVVEARRRHVQRHLDTVAGTSASGVTVDVRVGDPATELAAAAADGADLLVVGSRRWGAAERVALGGTAELLAHGSPCSLLVLPRPVGAPAASREPRHARFLVGRS
jgi:nucleotide-binding universal stress UspA family protein